MLKRPKTMLKLKPLPLGPRGRKLGLLLLVLVTVGIGLAAFGGMQAAFGPFAVRLTFPGAGRAKAGW